MEVLQRVKRLYLVDTYQNDKNNDIINYFLENNENYKKISDFLNNNIYILDIENDIFYNTSDFFYNIILSEKNFINDLYLEYNIIELKNINIYDIDNSNFYYIYDKITDIIEEVEKREDVEKLINLLVSDKKND